MVQMVMQRKPNAMPISKILSIGKGLKCYAN